MPSAALPMARLYQDRDDFSHPIIFSRVSCVSWFKYSQTSCPFVSIPGSSIPSFRFSCPFVSIRGSSIPRLRVHSCPFVVQVFPDFVSIRVHSWFKYSQFSWPFVSIRGHSWPFVVQVFPVFVFFACFVCFVVQVFPVFVVHSWSRPAGFRKKSGFWRDGTIFPEYIKSAMDPRGFSSKTATLQQG